MSIYKSFISREDVNKMDNSHRNTKKEEKNEIETLKKHSILYKHFVGTTSAKLLHCLQTFWHVDDPCQREIQSGEMALLSLQCFPCPLENNVLSCFLFLPWFLPSLIRSFLGSFLLPSTFFCAFGSFFKFDFDVQYFFFLRPFRALALSNQAEESRTSERDKKRNRY